MHIENLHRIIELAGLIFGILYVIRMAMEKRDAWVYGLFAVIFYAYSTFYLKLYGEFMLQFIYAALAIYGFFIWNENPNIKLSITTLNPLQGFLSILIGLILSSIFYYVLKYFNDSMPLLDAVSNGFALVATYLSTRKKIENWLLYIPIDFLISYMMYTKEMYFYMSLYIAYAFMAMIAYVAWLQKIKKTKDINAD